MTFRPLTLFWGGVVAGGLVGAAATVGVLYDRPGSAAVKKVGRILGVAPPAGGTWAAGRLAASRREYAYGHDSHLRVGR
jgi:hypothetical protein